MLVDDIGDVTVTNDGATILKLLEVEHPAAKVGAHVCALVCVPCFGSWLCVYGDVYLCSFSVRRCGGSGMCCMCVCMDACVRLGWTGAPWLDIPERPLGRSGSPRSAACWSRGRQLVQRRRPPRAWPAVRGASPRARICRVSFSCYVAVSTHSNTLHPYIHAVHIIA